MRSFEVPIKIRPDGKIELPQALLDQLPTDQAVRAIILLSEPTDAEESAAWSRLTAEQFLAGYAQTDAIYDGI
jgi:hypothetical protein